MAPRATDRNWLDASALVFGLTVRFDQHFELPAHECLVLAQRNALLQLHDVVSAGLCLVVRYAVIERCRLRPHLRGVREDPNVVELGFLHESGQCLELFLRFTGIAHDERGSHDWLGERVSRVVDQPASHVDVAGPVHGPQHVTVGVLDRHVQIR